MRDGRESSKDEGLGGSRQLISSNRMQYRIGICSSVET